MVLYGAGGHCKVIIDILETEGIPIDFIVDDDPSITKFLNYPVVRNTGRYDEMIIAVGDGAVRKKLVATLSVSHYLTAVHPSAVISPKVMIGEGTVIMGGVIVNVGASIGNHCIINTGASVDHDCVIEDFVHIAPHCTLCGEVYVGEQSWVGAGSTIIQGIHIGKNCFIGAGSVVVKDIPDHSFCFGNPCKVRRFWPE